MKKLLLILVILPLFADGQIITTIAGGGASTPSGIPATSASLFSPIGGVFDSHGNYYFCEYSSISRVNKIDNLGIITTVAGTGISGYNGDGGAANISLLSWPSGVIVDTLDNVYICDHENNRIRKIDIATGIISTVAGNGIYGYAGDGGPATNAAIAKPGNICFDKRGNLYIIDAYYHNIRVVTTSGTISTYAGNGTCGTGGNGGPATLAQVCVYGMCVDDSDNLYIAGSAHGVCRIDKINALTHLINKIAGTDTGDIYNGDNIPALSANMAPTTIQFDKLFANLYLTDYINNRIRRIDANGIIHTVAGSGIQGYGGDNGNALDAKLYYPSGITFDSCGNIFFGDQLNGRIRKVELNPYCWPAAIENISSIHSLTIRPNPTTNELTITSSDKITQITVTNLIGQTVFGSNYNNEKVQIAVSGLPSGIYFVRINGTEVRRFVKE